MAVHGTCCSVPSGAVSWLTWAQSKQIAAELRYVAASTTWPRSATDGCHVAGDIDRCLACHLADRDGLTQVTRGDRDDRVDVAAVRAALSAWNGHVMVRQPVAGPVEAWHALRRGLEHVVDLNDACMKITIAVTMMPTTATLTAPSSCLPSHVSGNMVSSLMFVWLPQRGWRDNQSIDIEARTCGQGRV